MALVLSHAYYNRHGRIADLFLEGKSLIEQTKCVGYVTPGLQDTVWPGDQVVEAQYGGCNGAMKACRGEVSLNYYHVASLDFWTHKLDR